MQIYGEALWSQWQRKIWSWITQKSKNANITSDELEETLGLASFHCKYLNIYFWSLFPILDIQQQMKTNDREIELVTDMPKNYMISFLLFCHRKQCIKINNITTWIYLKYLLIVYKFTKQTFERTRKHPNFICSSHLKLTQCNIQNERLSGKLNWP